MRILSPTEASYLAGLIDAEGTVTLARKHRNENRHLAISISNTDRSLLAFARAVVGAGKVTRKRVTKANHSPSFVFAIYNRQALALLARISPFFRTYKALRARAILTHYIELTPRNGKYTPAMRSARLAFEEQVLNICPGKTSTDSYIRPPTG